MSSLNWAIGGKMLIVIVLGLLGISIYGKFSGKASPGMKKFSTQALKYIYYVFSIQINTTLEEIAKVYEQSIPDPLKKYLL